jgi:hypothetical protein
MITWLLLDEDCIRLQVEAAVAVVNLEHDGVQTELVGTRHPRHQAGARADIETLGESAL